MTAEALDRSDVGRWVASILVVLGIHAGAVALLVSRQDLTTIGEPSESVVAEFDLTPVTTPPSDTVEDLPQGPKQEEQAPPPPPKEEKVEEKVDEKVDVPPSPAPAVAALPPPEPPHPKEPEPTPEVAPAPATTAPPRPHVSPAQIKTWNSEIVTRIERSKKAYPRTAAARNQKGVVQLAFSIDRAGHVVSASVLQSSGFEMLDQEALATVHRAEPFPAPPSGMAGETFAFKFPFKFNIR